MLIYRKEEGIKVPSSGHFLDNVTILDSSGYFLDVSPKTAKRRDNFKFKNIIFNLLAYRKEVVKSLRLQHNDMDPVSRNPKSS